MTSRSTCLTLVWLSGLLCTTQRVGAKTLVVDFESPPLAPASFDNGADAGGQFDLHGVRFVNDFSPNAFPPFFGFWSGWSLSRDTDTTTPGFFNQFSAFPGQGAGGSEQYAVAFSGFDVDTSVPGANPELARAAPDVWLPANAAPASVAVTNTTYTALSMLNGDGPGGFAGAFGGASGDDPDWYRLTVHGLDAGGASLAAVDFLLGDYRPNDNSHDYVVDQWTEIDLAPLAVEGVAGLSFRLASSDVGPNGMNTPAYVAIDNLTLSMPDAPPAGGLPGDYNRDDRVDAADYTLWRDTLDALVDEPGAGADGDGSGRVDAGDYTVWRNGFGAEAGAGTLATTAPEPAAAWLLMAVAALARRPYVSTSFAPGVD